MDYSPPGFSVHEILQARILEWVAVPSFRGSSWPRDWTCVSYNSCIGRWDFCNQHHLGSPIYSTYIYTMYNLVHIHTHNAQCTHMSQTLGYTSTWHCIIWDYHSVPFGFFFFFNLKPRVFIVSLKDHNWVNRTICYLVSAAGSLRSYSSACWTVPFSEA